jgi:hypothetical protein
MHFTLIYKLIYKSYIKVDITIENSLLFSYDFKIKGGCYLGCTNIGCKATTAWFKGVRAKFEVWSFCAPQKIPSFGAHLFQEPNVATQF